MIDGQNTPETADSTDTTKPAHGKSRVVHQIADHIRAKIEGKSILVGGKRYSVEFIEGSDQAVDQKIQEFYDFMAEPGHIEHDELADPETFKDVLVKGDIALNHIADKRFDQLTPETQPYFFINIRDPESGRIVSAMSGAMILERHEDGSGSIDATFMLSYVATAEEARGKGLPQVIADQAVQYFGEKNIHVTGMLTEAVDTFEKSANRINGCSRLYVRRGSDDGGMVLQQIEYLMPSQEYSLDGEPLQGTTSTSNLMMSFTGKDPSKGIRGSEVKTRVRAMWDWVYRKDATYYEQQHAEQGLKQDPERIAKAVATNNAYIDNLLERMFAQFGDDELVYPVTQNQRQQSPATFRKTALEQVESVKSVHLEELQQSDLDEVVRMTSAVFPGDGEHPKRCFEASLNPTDPAHQEYLKEINVDSLRYWVAKDSDGKVLGISGFYTTPEDGADAGWVGWYCVHPDARGRGVGTQLLDRVEAEAVQAKKKALRLYTSDQPSLVKANLQYEKRGYKEVHREPSDTPGVTMIVRQKNLGETEGNDGEPPAFDAGSVVYL